MKHLLLFIWLVGLMTGCKAETPPVSEIPLTEPELPAVIAFPAEYGGRVNGLPDFLTEEQAIVYENAYGLYNALFAGGTGGIDRLFPTIYDYELLEVDDLYASSLGNVYQDWSLFDEMVHSVYTEGLWTQLNQFEWRGTPLCYYFEEEGKTFYLEFGKGSGYYYNPNFSDEFELLEQTDEIIRFEIIGHYEQMNPLEGESEEARNRRLETTWSEKKSIPVTMVKTEEGWRFSEFSTPLENE